MTRLVARTARSTSVGRAVLVSSDTSTLAAGQLTGGSRRDLGRVPLDTVVCVRLPAIGQEAHTERPGLVPAVRTH